MRTFFMATDNSNGMTDYWALATGGGLGYHSPIFYGFQIGMEGFVIANIASNDLGSSKKPKNQMSRYEIGLFDVQEPHNRFDLDRLEHLFIRYHFNPKSKLELGRFELNTPFINPQDGRMRGTLEEGIWGEWNSNRKIQFEGGWIWAISPRSTVRWFSIGQSMGVYPAGLNSNGLPSKYPNNIYSDGIGIFSLKLKPKKWADVQLWHYHVDNVFRINMAQVDFNFKLDTINKIYLGLSLTHQNAIRHGGHPDQEKTYIEKGAQSLVASGRIGYVYKTWDINFNYTRITKQGKFLMPREWGRDPFFTFMPRERNEGYADLNASVFRIKKSWSKKSSLELSQGLFNLPDANDFSKNKYAFPSYLQTNLMFKRKFSKMFKGADVMFLWMYKHNHKRKFTSERFVFNKVNMHHWNLVLNYAF
ncbi:MAG: hypothetical protein SNJ77_08180 [Cytophagales bacterium]